MGLLNLRNALMAGKRLPYDAEVEYLESTGTQWIEVPMVVDSSATVNITGYVGATNKELFSFDKLGTKQFNIETSATFYRWWTSERINVGSGYVGALHSYKCNSSIWVDGVLKGTSTPTDTSTTQTFYILNGYHNAASGRIYHVSVEYGGRLIFDGIPVRKGTVGYLYDRVSGKLFGNAGTGDFVLGPDVVPVEYIESHGTERILTDIYTDANTAIKCKASGTSGSFFGVLPSSQSAWWTILPNDSGKLRYYYGGSGATDVATIDATVPHDYQCSNKVLVDGVEAISLSRTLGSANVPLSLFARTASSGISFTSLLVGRMWYLQIIQSGATVRSFRSVRVGTEGAMMDTLTRRIYRNSGTGAFTYGNDLPYPIPA